MYFIQNSLFDRVRVRSASTLLRLAPRLPSSPNVIASERDSSGSLASLLASVARASDRLRLYTAQIASQLSVFVSPFRTVALPFADLCKLEEEVCECLYGWLISICLSVCIYA
jgi:hypothetical protein